MPTQLRTVLLEIDSFKTPRDFRNLLILAESVIPLSQLETLKGVPELFDCMKERGWKEPRALAVLKRMLEKAQFNHKYVKKLKKFISEEEESKPYPEFYFRELIVLVGNKLGDGDSLQSLLFLLTDEQLGVARQNIQTAPQLLHCLLHREVLTPQKLQQSLHTLEDWMAEIGRNDIATDIKLFQRSHPIPETLFQSGYHVLQDSSVFIGSDSSQNITIEIHQQVIPHVSASNPLSAGSPSQECLQISSVHSTQRGETPEHNRDGEKELLISGKRRHGRRRTGKYCLLCFCAPSTLLLILAVVLVATAIYMARLPAHRNTTSQAVVYDDNTTVLVGDADPLWYRKATVECSSTLECSSKLNFNEASCCNLENYVRVQTYNYTGTAIPNDYAKLTRGSQVRMYMLPNSSITFTTASNTTGVELQLFTALQSIDSCAPHNHYDYTVDFRNRSLCLYWPSGDKNYDNAHHNKCIFMRNNSTPGYFCGIWSVPTDVTFQYHVAGYRQYYNSSSMSIGSHSVKNNSSASFSWSGSFFKGEQQCILAQRMGPGGSIARLNVTLYNYADIATAVCITTALLIVIIVIICFISAALYIFY